LHIPDDKDAAAEPRRYRLGHASCAVRIAGQLLWSRIGTSERQFGTFDHFGAFLASPRTHVSEPILVFGRGSYYNAPWPDSASATGVSR